MLDKTNKNLRWFFLAWLISTLAYSVYANKHQKIILQETLSSQSSDALRLISQRADQHDAHLTNVSALAQALNVENESLFYQVTDAILAFYPRITNIDLVPLFDDDLSLSTREDLFRDPRLDAVIRNSARASSGELIVQQSPISNEHYLLIKRSPNSEQAKYGLALEIDLKKLVSNVDDFWINGKASLSLSFKNQKLLNTDENLIVIGQNSNRTTVYQSVLGSRSQPFLLKSQLSSSFGERYPIKNIALVSFLIAIALLSLFLLINAKTRTRNAELRAKLGEQDARIAHASRVNALGEMASGMAHELTQPLTSILSQSQAGVHMLNAEVVDLPAARKVLETNIAQSKRAASIITQFRNWTRKTERKYFPQDIANCVDNVLLLINNESKELGIEITKNLQPQLEQVLGNAVEIEQIIFNLVRNALESFDSREHLINDPKIHLTANQDDNKIILTVEDNGPGISDDMYRRLFEPFATNKENGTGLGLALCSRIVDRMDGEIEVKNLYSSGVIATLIFPVLNEHKDIESGIHRNE